jgi:DNA-binding NarL/FixJ family response regulator
MCGTLAACGLPGTAGMADASRPWMDGAEALSAGRWAESVRLFEAALDDVQTDPARAQILDELADARWWQGDVRGAAAARESGYRIRRACGDLPGAARAAAWLAREYAASLAEMPIARGWLARGETIARSVADPGVEGWIALARATLASSAHDQVVEATHAVDCARAVDDGDLEVLALARLGLALVTDGSVDAGLAALDEALVAASGGDAEQVTTAGQLCCDLVLAAELAGDRQRLATWFAQLDRVRDASGQPSPVSFCTTCCGETAAVQGDFRNAEQRLHIAVIELQRSGARSRCIQPGTRLAELLLDQGRVEEARRAVGDHDDPASLAVRARIAMSAGEPVLGAALADRAARRFGTGSAASVAALGTLVEAHLEAGDQAAAAAALDRLAQAVGGSTDHRSGAQLALARGRVAVVSGADEEAVVAFEAALDAVSGTVCLEAAHAHLALARLHHADRPSVARVDAKAAMAAFEALGSSRLADAAAALLRSLGDRSRVGPKDVGVLPKREQEILLLVAQGLTNAEIARRLYISTKTSGNHVSAILAKLGVRSRTEAAAYAAMNVTAAS